jgi:hypothetical protein
MVAVTDKDLEANQALLTVLKVRFDSYAVLPRLRNARLCSERLRRLKTDRIDLYPGHQN